MTNPLIDRWRPVSQPTPGCQARQCYTLATQCHEWQTPGMPALAFWYGCDKHAAQAKQRAHALAVSSGLNNQWRQA